jgi:hypothetical protein
MKKLILILAFILLACTPKSEIIKDPIFEENYIQYNEDGTKSYIVEDPIFEGNYIVYPEPRYKDCE